MVRVRAGAGQPVSFLPDPRGAGVDASPAFATSLVYVMFAYSGWNAAIYVAGDIKSPGRYLPLSLVFGTLIVVLLYAPLNAVFLYSAPISELKGQLDVGYVAANHIFGGTGALVMGLMISIGLVSAISSMVWAGPRVTQVMGEDIQVLQPLARTNANGVPFVSLAFQYALVVGLIVTSTFDAIVNYIGFILSLSAFLTVLGVFVLRIGQPNLPRPYRVWGYPVTPIIFLAGDRLDDGVRRQGPSDGAGGRRGDAARRAGRLLHQPGPGAGGLDSERGLTRALTAAPTA